MNDEWELISVYPWQQAVADGQLVEILKHRWPELTGGKPLLATISIYEAFSLAAIMEMWNEYVRWVQTIMPTLREQDKMFTTMMNGETIWLIDDGATFTLLYPEDY